MAKATLISVDEYLHTDYQPDCDYVDGVVEERNRGENPHSSLQGEFIVALHRYCDILNIRVYPEQRVQTQSARFRIPDVCVTLGKSDEAVFRRPPFLCVEILSSEDRMSRVEKRLEEYLDMGVSYVWVVDPLRHDAWIYSASGKRAVTDGMLRTGDPEMEIDLSELFRLAEE
ncbi:MAG: Uma2 family endonuclease [Acidobacteriota bacterium]|nr:Uma2 family endonuclease [Acidobacteriota bacterium]